jgi:hypothetical protein
MTGSMPESTRDESPVGDATPRPIRNVILELRCENHQWLSRDSGSAWVVTEVPSRSARQESGFLSSADGDPVGNDSSPLVGYELHGCTSGLPRRPTPCPVREWGFLGVTPFGTGLLVRDRVVPRGPIATAILGNDDWWSEREFWLLLSDADDWIRIHLPYRARLMLLLGGGVESGEFVDGVLASTGSWLLAWEHENGRWPHVSTLFRGTVGDPRWSALRWTRVRGLSTTPSGVVFATRVATVPSRYHRLLREKPDATARWSLSAGLLRSDDLGATWRPVAHEIGVDPAVPGGRWAVERIQWLDERVGYALCASVTEASGWIVVPSTKHRPHDGAVAIVRTTDQGLTWTAVRVFERGEFPGPIRDLSSVLFAVRPGD